MSSHDQLPFTPNARFRAVRPIEFDRVYSYDELIPEDLPELLLRKLYEQRRIYVDGPKAQAAAAEKAAAAPAPKPSEAKPDVPLKYKVKQAGMGGFKVLDADGKPIGPGFKTHAEALAEAQRLSAQQEA